MKQTKAESIKIISLAVPFLLVVCGRGADTPPTTRQQTVRPFAVPADTRQILPKEVALYQDYGYSAWQIGPGEDEGKKFDLMPAGYAGATNAARLVSYFSMSDVHITDKESPAQVPYVGWSAPYREPGVGGLNHSSYSPIILSTTQVLDATVKTVNALHRQTPFNFGICLGDVANCSQYNELRWFIDVMDGQFITPSSGAHLGADTIEYQKPYQAAGLDRSIPWYQVIGNHDQFWMGVHYPTEKLRNTLVGTNVLNMSTNLFAPNASELTGLYAGVVDGTTVTGDIIKGGPTNNFSAPPTVAADANRRTLTTTNSSTVNFMSEFFHTTSLPVGHGFTTDNIASNSACYTFEPVANLPLKVIVLDDTCKTPVPDDVLEAKLEPIVGKTTAQILASTAAGFGYMDAARNAWLTNELQKGQDAGQLMIIACHIPINPQADLTHTNAAGMYFPPNYSTETNLIATLHHYPNLILLMAGHRHCSVVTPQPSPDPAHPEYGFWEVETPSLRDFPQQFRTWEILRNSDNTISILTTDVDPQVEDGSLAADSRGYAIGAYRLFGNGALDDISPQTYNAELIKPLAPAMQAKIAGYGTPLVHLLSIGRDASGEVITFTGKLQSADSILGPWTEVQGATSPYAVSAPSGTKFYRAVD
jgi:metallophosphoesterase (TIGR03768 family)